jgi:hypothetical protein
MAQFAPRAGVDVLLKAPGLAVLQFPDVHRLDVEGLSAEVCLRWRLEKLE